MCVCVTHHCVLPGNRRWFRWRGEDEQEAAAEAAEKFLSEDLPENVFGAVKAGSGMWSSCLKIMHTTEGKTLELVQQNEAAFRCAVCTLI